MASDNIQSTKLDLPGKGSSNIADIMVKDIPASLIVPFNGIPDFLSEYRLPYPAGIYKEEKFLIIGGYQKFQVGPGSLETVRCIEYVLSDNSDESIAIEKIALFVKPAGGKASFAEIVRALASFTILIKNCPDTTFIEGWGGLRRGKEFEEGESLTQLLADRLGKSPDTTRKYIYFGKDLSPECLEELAKSKAGRKFFEAIQPKKTKFIDTFTSKSAAEIIDLISAKVLQWWIEYTTPKEPKPKPPETKQQTDGNRGKVENQPGTQGNQGSPVVEQPVGQSESPTGQQAATQQAAPQNLTPGQPESPTGQPATTLHQDPPMGQAAVDQQATTPDPDQQNELGDNMTPHEDDPEEEQEEANDIKPVNTQPAPLHLVTTGGGAQDATSDIYAEMNKIGTKLIDASNEKLANEALHKKIQEIMAELTTLLRMASEMDSALPTMTLAGAM
jgi:hypothetical protein